MTSGDEWAQWDAGPDEDQVEDEGGWTPPEVEKEEEDWQDVPDEEEGTDVDPPAKYARTSSGAMSSRNPAKYAWTSSGAMSSLSQAKNEGTDRRAAKLSDPWAVLHVPTGSPTGSNEQAKQSQEVKQEGGASRKRVSGKLAGWTDAEQVVEAMAAIGMEGKITTREDIRTRIEAPTQFGFKPRYVVYHYPTTRAVLCQGKLADDVRARLADWQAGNGQ